MVLTLLLIKTHQEVEFTLVLGPKTLSTKVLVNQVKDIGPEPIAVFRGAGGVPSEVGVDTDNSVEVDADGVNSVANPR